MYNNTIMKKLIIFLIVLLIGILLYGKYGQISGSVDLADHIKISAEQKEETDIEGDEKEVESNVVEMSTEVKNRETVKVVEINSTTNSGPFCESSSGKKLYLSEAKDIASGSFCASQGVISDEYTCETKEGENILALFLGSKASRFGEPGEVCDNRCEISIDSRAVNGNKKCYQG
jgi:preprotein translocase subunit SecF